MSKKKYILLPPLKKFLRYTYPSKASVLGLLLTILGLILTVVFFLWDDIFPPEPTVLEKIAMSEIKPEVRVDKVELSNWVGDKEPFLSVSFVNYTKYDALKFRPNLMQLSGRPPFSQSKAGEVLYGPNLSLPSGKELLIPLASLSELQGYIEAMGISGRVFGVGTVPNLPKIDKGQIGYFQREAIGVPLKYVFQDILGDVTTVESYIYLYIDVS